MKSKIHSSDLFESAFLLCSECRLDEVHVQEKRGKTVVTFLISGKDAEKACQAYRFGTATVNVTTLKHSLKHLKDVMFNELRRTRSKSY